MYSYVQEHRASSARVGRRQVREYLWIDWWLDLAQDGLVLAAGAVVADEALRMVPSWRGRAEV